ncbi:MAG: DNA polymerase, partial [Gemmatimonadales bacterium]
AKFDLAFLRAAGVPWPAVPIFDTQLAAMLLGAGTAEGTLRQTSLELVAARHLGASLDKTLQGSDWGGSLSPSQLAYAAADATTTLRLVPVLKAALEAAGLTQAAAIEFGCVPALAWLETCGVPIDAARWRDRAVREAHQAEALEAQLCATLLASRGGSGLLLVDAFHWKSPAQVLDLLQQRGHAITSTDSSTLAPLAGADPLIPLLLDYREADKRAGTYGVPWLEKAVHPLTGRVHASYSQLGSAAGRMSCTKPNIQNLPRSATYRGCITADPGWCIVKADYSQIELRLGAVIAGDTAMLTAYRSGADLHAATAARLTGVPVDQVTPEARQLAKAVNFGLLYGMGAPRLQGHAQDMFRVTMTAADAQRYR